jgi:hypothetical protein
MNYTRTFQRWGSIAEVDTGLVLERVLWVWTRVDGLPGRNKLRPYDGLRFLIVPAHHDE